MIYIHIHVSMYHVRLPGWLEWMNPWEKNRPGPVVQRLLGEAYALYPNLCMSNLHQTVTKDDIVNKVSDYAGNGACGFSQELFICRRVC